jgi:hypothetical protein
MFCWGWDGMLCFLWRLAGGKLLWLARLLLSWSLGWTTQHTFCWGFSYVHLLVFPGCWLLELQARDIKVKNKIQKTDHCVVLWVLRPLTDFPYFSTFRLLTRRVYSCTEQEESHKLCLFHIPEAQVLHSNIWAIPPVHVALDILEMRSQELFAWAGLEPRFSWSQLLK